MFIHPFCSSFNRDFIWGSICIYLDYCVEAHKQLLAYYNHFISVVDVRRSDMRSANDKTAKSLHILPTFRREPICHHCHTTATVSLFLCVFLSFIIAKYCALNILPQFFFSSSSLARNTFLIVFNLIFIVKSYSQNVFTFTQHLNGSATCSFYYYHQQRHCERCERTISKSNEKINARCAVCLFNNDSC